MRIKDTEIKIIQGDITALEVEAIVNAANNKLVMGGGVAGAIKKKGGRIIEDEAVKKGPINIGEAVATSAGNLPAKYVIHAATMGMPACRQAGIFQTDEIKIRSSCRNSLRVAQDLNLKTIAFPALGCGVGGFPLLSSAKIMAQEVFRYLKEEKVNLKEIIFCLYDQEAYDIFNKGIIGYLEYITTKLQNGPFTTVDAIIEIPASPAGGLASPAGGLASPAGGNDGIVVIERSNPPFGLALPGGFVDYGESLEEAVIREAKEETDLDLEDLRQFHTYSAPGRDPRFQTIATVFIAQGKGVPKAGDDAQGLKIIKLSEIQNLTFAFDHKDILQDYLAFKKDKEKF